MGPARPAGEPGYGPPVTDASAGDEFGLLHENAAEQGIPWRGPPVVRRRWVVVDADGRKVSALVWGAEPPELVFLHGGAQNAHTWDTVALALDRPLVAIDLPGHGHSDHTHAGPFLPRVSAQDIAVAIRTLAPDAAAVVGMSLGGLIGIALATRAPELVRRLVLVDVTPGVDRDKAAPIRAFISGPESFASFDEILDRTATHNPTRSVASLRRGIVHNARRRDDGRWVWRYQRNQELDEPQAPVDFTELWNDLGAIAVPVLLARGMLVGMGGGSVVVDDDVAEFRRRQPSGRVEQFERSGHSLQGDEPVRLARVVADFVGG